MPVMLRLSFLGGRYHATPWGRHVNEGVPEWPPSPWRLLRALIAVWKRTCPEVPEENVKRALQQLVAPPRFYLPAHRVAHTRHYMPWEKKGPQDRTLVFDTFVSIDRQEPLLIGWPESNLNLDEEQCLQRLIAGLSVLGRAETMVEATLIHGGDHSTVNWNCVPAVADEQNLIPVFCAEPGTCFDGTHYPSLDPAKLAKGKVKPADYLFDCPPWHLCLDTEAIHSKRWTTVPGSKWVNYTRPIENRGRTSRSIAARKYETNTSVIQLVREPDSSGSVHARRRDLPTVARFVIDGPVLPHVTETLAVAEAVRRAAMGCFRRWCERHLQEAEPFRRTDVLDRFASSVLSGKDADGQILTGPGHAHYWPTVTETDSRLIGGVTIFARDGFCDAEIASLAEMRFLRVGELNELRIQLIGLGPTEILGPNITGPSATWRSVTPFLGHADIGIGGRARFMRKGVRREWRRLATQISTFIDIELLNLTELTAEEVNRFGLPAPREYRRSRLKHGGRESYRPAAMYRLTFSQPLIGPLVLGYANHFGMGLFAPE